MLALRKLVLRGHSYHVSLHPKMIDYLRWKVTDTLAVEVIDLDTVMIRRAQGRDLSVAAPVSMNVDLSEPVITK